jgi:signal transduction histidine kinase
LGQSARDAIDAVIPLCAARDEAALPRIEEINRQLASLLQDALEPPDYHPRDDQVAALALRPLIEQVFRWQQRLLDAPYVSLRLELGQEHIHWFPARLRHILDNLISNALRYRDADKGEARLTVGLCVAQDCYELRITDNGLGMPPTDDLPEKEPSLGSSPERSAGLGVGLAVVRVLIQQCGGSLTTQTNPGCGTSFVATLPRYDVDDFLT